MFWDLGLFCQLLLVVTLDVSLWPGVLFYCSVTSLHFRVHLVLDLVFKENIYPFKEEEKKSIRISVPNV